MLYFLLVLCLICGCVTLVLYLKTRVNDGPSVKALIIKSVVSVFFMATAAVATACSAPQENIGFAMLIITGLLFGLLGDIWLDLKWIYKQTDEKIYTFSGFYCFAIQHVLFIIAIIKYFGDSGKILYIILPLILGIAAGVINGNIGKFMKLDYGIYKAVTIFYGSILIGVTLLTGSIALMHSFGVATLNVMFVGIVLFLISDLILSGTYFGKGKDGPKYIISNYIAYYLAQFLIAASLMLLA